MKPSKDTTPRRPPLTSIGFSVSVPEALEIRRAAEEERITISRLLRRRLGLDARPPDDGDRER